jgi:nucleoside-diphosphate-sugar epimerase
MQFLYVKDLVTAMITATEVEAAVGHAFNVANPRAMTQTEVLDDLIATAGKEAEIVRVPRDRIARAGGHPMGPHLYFGCYFDVPPITMLVNKAQRVLQFKPCSFVDGLKETYKWYIRHHLRPPVDYEFEDKLLNRAQLAS